MPFDVVLLVAQLAAVFFLAAWLSIGVFENIFYPQINGPFTAEVLDMARMREDYPEAYAKVSYRRVSGPAVQKALFRLIVAWEFTATLALWAGVGAMALAVFGVLNPETGRAWGLLGALCFTTTWAGFLVAGNWFCYWFCHESAQNTHFQMTLWGLGTVILVGVGGSP